MHYIGASNRAHDLQTKVTKSQKANFYRPLGFPGQLWPQEGDYFALVAPYLEPWLSLKNINKTTVFITQFTAARIESGTWLHLIIVIGHIHWCHDICCTTKEIWHIFPSISYVKF